MPLLQAKLHSLNAKMSVNVGQNSIVIPGIVGLSAHKAVFMAIAPAGMLFDHSFVDVLNEETEQG